MVTVRPQLTRAVEVVTRDAPVPAAPEAGRRGKRGDKEAGERPPGGRAARAKDGA